MKLEFKAELMDEKYLEKKKLEVDYTINEDGTERFELTIFSHTKKGHVWKGEKVHLQDKDLHDFFTFISSVRRRMSFNAKRIMEVDEND